MAEENLRLWKWEQQELQERLWPSVYLVGPIAAGIEHCFKNKYGKDLSLQTYERF